MPHIVEESLHDAEGVLQEAAAAGIDLKSVAEECLQEGLATFDEDFKRLLEEVEKGLGRQAQQRLSEPARDA